MPVTAVDNRIPVHHDWAQDLAAAFTVMLGRPVDSFDPSADYALLYRNAPGMARFFELLSDADDLGRVYPANDGVRHRVLGVCLGLDWGLDLARSAFEFDFVDDPALAGAIESLSDDAFLDEHRMVLPGAALASAMVAHQIRPADIVAAIDADTISVGVTLRVATDSTLRHAMLTATRTAAGPDGLRPGKDEIAALPFVTGVFTDTAEELSAEVAAERDRILAPICDSRLRAHIWSPFLDVPWDRGKDGRTRSEPAGSFRSPTATFVAAWDLAYFGEVSLAVVQTGGLPPA